MLNVFSISENSDRSHRIQTELRELHVIVDEIRLRRAEVPPQDLLELSAYVVHKCIAWDSVHRSGRNTLVPSAEAMHCND